MVATPFKGTITFRYLDGEPDSQAFSCSDVTGADAVFTASALTFYSTRKKGVIADISLVAAGVDTSQIKLYINNKDTGNTILGAGVVATVNNRVPVPIPIVAAAQVQLRQIT
jgi:hypothetical protein